MSKIIKCDCECHDPEASVIHFEACCDVCPKCKRGFVVGIREHIEGCTLSPPRLKRKRKRQPK